MRFKLSCFAHMPLLGTKNCLQYSCVTLNWCKHVPNVLQSLPGNAGMLDIMPTTTWKWHERSNALTSLPGDIRYSRVVSDTTWKWSELAQFRHVFFGLGIWFRGCRVHKPQTELGFSSLSPSLVITVVSILMAKEHVMYIITFRSAHHVIGHHCSSMFSFSAYSWHSWK